MNRPHNFNIVDVAGCARAPGTRIAFGALVILLICAVSCTSTWQQSIRDYQPPSQSLLASRAVEARDAIAIAAKNAVTAAESLGTSSESIPPAITALDDSAWNASKAIASVRDVGDAVRAELSGAAASRYDTLARMLDQADGSLQSILNAIDPPSAAAAADNIAILRREAGVLTSQLSGIERTVSDLAVSLGTSS